ncbi:MAG: CAP domain-containing protein [Oscillospiraceae bacterium]|jgi:uncharacterized protein YkwD|nr:CAP domain-containing protein [Oscillospiraceae bacterium]
MKKLIVIAAAFAVILCGCVTDRAEGSGEAELSTPPLAGISEAARGNAEPQSKPGPQSEASPTALSPEKSEAESEAEAEREDALPEAQSLPGESESAPPANSVAPSGPDSGANKPEPREEPQQPESQPAPQPEPYGGTAFGQGDVFEESAAAEQPAALRQEEKTGIDAEAFEEELFRLINGERESRGESALGMEERLRWAARLRAPEVLDDLSHTRPDGSSYYTSFEEAGFDYAGKWHGENVSRIQFTQGMYTTREAARFMFSQLAASTGHLNNMTSENYDQAGIGVSIRVEGDMVTVASAQLFAG